MKRLISILSQERPPRASLRYFEKCLVILDMLQVQALLFGLSQPWSGTYLWLENTQWTACFNLDLFLLSKHGAPMGARGGTRSLWGEMDSVIPRYCVPFVLVFVPLGLSGPDVYLVEYLVKKTKMFWNEVGLTVMSKCTFYQEIFSALSKTGILTLGIYNFTLR